MEFDKAVPQLPPAITSSCTHVVVLGSHKPCTFCTSPRMILRAQELTLPYLSIYFILRTSASYRPPSPCQDYLSLRCRPQLDHPYPPPPIAMIFPATLLTLLGVVTTLSFATPVRRTVSNGAALNADFPDPSIMRNSDGVWYAYSTSSGAGLVPMSKSTDFKTWSARTNVLSSVGAWATGWVYSDDTSASCYARR